jgi:hypothetical protein
LLTVAFRHIWPPNIPGAHDADGDGSKLKGVFWPGMNLFDSATTEMKRMRNQRKDGTILAQMKSTSLGVEPNEYIYTIEGEFQRVRDIFDSSTESSPVSFLVYMLYLPRCFKSSSISIEDNVLTTVTGEK